MHWTSVAVGAMALALLDAVLAHQGAAGRLGSGMAHFGAAVQRFLSPAIPAFSTAQPTAAPATKK